jgi:cytochrome c-type biogenesis protein CcmH
MLLFWILATLMTAVALAFVLVPMLRRPRNAARPSAREANLEVLRGQRREIEADVASGVLPADAREEALAELVDRAATDLAPEGKPDAVRSERPWLAAALAALVVPLVSFGIYLAVGMPGASDPKNVARQESAHNVDDPNVIAMVESLAAKMRERPDDVQGWSLLARSMGALGRYREAADAYAHLARLVPNDPQVLADYADALGMAQGRSLAGKPYELVKAALTIDPKHHKSLALAGTAAMDAGDYGSAVRYWETLAADLPPGSQDESQVRAIVDEVRTRASAAGKPLAASPQVARAATPSSSPAPAKTLAGSVSIAPEVASKITGSETLFIFAQAEGGARIPLAVIRTSVRDLPMKFALDDTMAMSPEAKLSSAAAVRVEARITRSGTPQAQPGDLFGRSDVVKPGARDVKIVVNQVVP